MGSLEVDKNLDFIVPIREAVAKVMSSFSNGGFVELKDVPFGTTNFYLKSNVVIIVGIIGPMRGRIIFSFNPNMAEELSRTMLNMDSVGDLELIHSTCQEFTNMVTGAAVCHPSLDPELDITPPTVLFSEKLFISSMGTPIHLIPFELNGARLNVLVSVK